MCEVRVKCYPPYGYFRDKMWPNRMAVRPMVGDLVKSGNGVERRIKQIVHATEIVRGAESDGNSVKHEVRENPILIVRLAP